MVKRRCTAQTAAAAGLSGSLAVALSPPETRSFNPEPNADKSDSNAIVSRSNRIPSTAPRGLRRPRRAGSSAASCKNAYNIHADGDRTRSVVPKRRGGFIAGFNCPPPVLFLQEKRTRTMIFYCGTTRF